MALKGTVPFLEADGLCMPNRRLGNFTLFYVGPKRPNCPAR